MAERLPPIKRPNGKFYQPRKIVTEYWENNYGDEDCGVVVLGTHDVECAKKLATQAIQFGEPVDPVVGWFRDAFDDRNAGYRRAWIDDPVRGRAGVMFTAVEE